MRNNGPNFSSFIYLVKLILLTCFLVFAVGFIIYKTGFAGIAAFLLVCCIFLPMFLTPPAKFKRRSNMFIDPVYKGWLGNIWTKK